MRRLNAPNNGPHRSVPDQASLLEIDNLAEKQAYRFETRTLA